MTAIWKSVSKDGGAKLPCERSYMSKSYMSRMFNFDEALSMLANSARLFD
jgi:hypothetical protein